MASMALSIVQTRDKCYEFCQARVGQSSHRANLSQSYSMCQDMGSHWKHADGGAIGLSWQFV